uniref:Sporozoite antigen n=1 Tax=Eimeria acervulina TaxID=5801 RepID=O76507_EIMAC|nr:unknown protein RB1-a [Eimeria acervulina]
MADLFSGLVGGVVGAVAAVDVPAEGERLPRPAPGTEWSLCCSKLGESGRELEGFVQQLTFILGKLASCMRVGIEHLSRCVAEGRPPSSCPCLMNKADIDEGIGAGKQGADYLIRGGKLVLEALLEAAKVAATRGLILVEGSKDIILRNIPQTQEKLSQAYSSFLRGYEGSGRSLGGYAPSYQQQQQHPSSYGAAPSSQQASGFFW